MASSEDPAAAAAEDLGGGSAAPGAAAAADGSPQPAVVGEMVRHVAAGQEAVCHLTVAAPGAQGGAINKDNVDINVLSPSKVPVSYRLKEEGGGLLSVMFKPLEVGTFVMDIYHSGQKIAESPVFFKVYDSSLIKVSDIRNGVVGQPSQFRVDASQAGEGQLEISINDGEVPNHVQVLGGGRCLVHFTPEMSKPHTIDIKFNGEPVPGCPFVCQMADTSKVSVALHHLELMPVHKKASFQIHVDTADNAELAVSVTGPRKDVPVQVTGNVKDGFVAQFVPDEVGPYVVGVEYNNVPVGGTPFTGKAYDFSNVIVSPIPWGTIGKGLEFTVDASRAGEGNLEITISARGRNIPTQVHPQGSARFAVSFVPLEATDHVVNITFNKDSVPGAPFIAKIHTDPNRILVSGQSLAATAVGRASQFTLSNVVGSVDDLDIVIDSPSGDSVPAKVHDAGEGSFDVEFCPQVAGEHQIYLSFGSEPIPGSPFACKVYDVEAIKVRECQKGIVGKPVTFLVETSRAGPGNLEVTVNNGQVPTSAQAQGNHTYAISFVPKEAKPHVVELKFNGENVPGSPFKCGIVDAAKVNLSGDGLEKVAVGQQATFFIEGQFDMGDPEVKIVGPNKRVLASSIRFIGEGHFAVDYNPALVGDHQVEVKMGDVQVQGSPFVIKAYDVSKVAVSNVTSGFVGKPVYFNIDASQAGAGNLEIIVSVNGKNVPNYVQSEGNAKFRVNFKPTEALTHMLSVKFNNEFVPNSPFACEIQGSKTVQLNGPGLQLCPAGRETHFDFLDASSVGSYEVSILSPSGEELPFRLDRAAGRVTYAPLEVGPHMVRISGQPDGVPVEGSPFTCNVYDVDKISIAGLPDVGAVGRAITFTVDASKAGEGTLELVVTTAKTSVRAEVSARSRGLYDVTFVPQDLLPHFINVTFNEEHVQRSPFKCDIVSSDSQLNSSGGGDGAAQEVDEASLFATRGKPTHFEVSEAELAEELGDKLRIVDPQGKSCKFERANTKSGATRLKFVPKSVGAYLLRTPSDVDIQVKNVYDASLVKVMQPEPAVAGQPSSLIIDTGGAGKGALSVSMRAAGYDVEHSIRELEGNNSSTGRFEVSFVPRVPAPHRLEVRFNGAPVVSGPGARPIELPVRDPMAGRAVTAAGNGLYQARVGKQTNFVIDTLGRKTSTFDVVVTGPPDAMPPYEAVPIRCYQQKDGNLLAEFQTSAVGVHKIEVLEGGRLIHGAPFHCNSFDPSAVRLSALPPKQKKHSTGVPVQFQVDRRLAGRSDLDVTVTSPLGDGLPVEVKGLTEDENVDLVEFRPDASGKYKFVLRYGGEQIPDSPVTFSAQDDGLVLSAEDVFEEDVVAASSSAAAAALSAQDVRHELRVFGQGLQRAQVDQAATFEMEYVDAGGNADSESSPARRRRPDFPDVDVARPDGSPLKCSVSRGDNDSMVVRYTPDRIGRHLVSLRFPNGHTMDYPISVSDSRSIRLLGGFDRAARDFSPRLCAGVESRLQLGLDEREAGPGGKLEAEVTQVDGDRQLMDSSARRKADVVRVADARVEVRFIPLAGGEHALSLKYNGFPLAFSPLRGWAASSEMDHHGPPSSQHGKVKLTGMGLARAVANEPNFFLIDGSKGGVSGAPKVYLAANEIEVPVELRAVQKDVYEAAYVPRLSGSYQLSVTWGGRLVKGCPLTISTEDASAPHNSPASKVFCSGEGLRQGTLGKDICSFIDTRKAGPGELSLHCVGPKGKTAYCELNDHQDGTFTLNLKPQEPGRHQLSVKYGGQHVKGSPFSVRVSGAPDPDRVKVYGPGVEHGVLAMYQSRFICDTRGAGAGQLTVRIRGPKGAFRVEMQRESQKDRTILCKYEPTEPGDYRIEVKWSGEHVPGSPFVVMIFDTQEELARFLQSGGYSSPHAVGGGGGGASDLYGSIGPSHYGHYGISPWSHHQHPGSQIHHMA